MGKKIRRPFKKCGLHSVNNKGCRQEPQSPVFGLNYDGIFICVLKPAAVVAGWGGVCMTCREEGLGN